MAKHGTQHLFIVRNEQGIWIFDPPKLHYPLERGRLLKREDEDVLQGHGPAQFVKVAERCMIKIEERFVIRLAAFDLDVKTWLRRSRRLTVRPLLVDVNGQLDQVTGLIKYVDFDAAIRRKIILPHRPAQAA